MEEASKTKKWNGKTLFEVNPSQAMFVLFKNKKALIVMSIIVARCQNGLNNSFHLEHENVDGYDVFLDISNIEHNYKMSRPVVKSTLERIQDYGFIKILKPNLKCKYRGMVLVKVIVNPFRLTENELNSVCDYFGYQSFSNI